MTMTFTKIYLDTRASKRGFVKEWVDKCRKASLPLFSINAFTKALVQGVTENKLFKKTSGQALHS